MVQGELQAEPAGERAGPVGERRVLGLLRQPILPLKIASGVNLIFLNDFLWLFFSALLGKYVERVNTHSFLVLICASHVCLSSMVLVVYHLIFCGETWLGFDFS